MVPESRGEGGGRPSLVVERVGFQDPLIPLPDSPLGKMGRQSPLMLQKVTYYK
jgi:hypothetical protein